MMDQDSNPNKSFVSKTTALYVFHISHMAVCGLQHFPYWGTSKGAPCYVLDSSTHFLKIYSVKVIKWSWSVCLEKLL